MIEMMLKKIEGESFTTHTKEYGSLEVISLEAVSEIVQKVAKEYASPSVFIDTADERNLEEMMQAIKRMKVIPMQPDGGWVPVTYHAATDEEREEMCLPEGITYILDCPMPDDEQEIIVCNERYVWVDTCMIDEGYSLDSGNDWCGDIVAWMPMPKKYEPKKQQNNRRNNIIITYNGKTQTLSQWSDEIGIDYHKLLIRLQRGWSIERAFNKK